MTQTKKYRGGRRTKYTHHTVARVLKNIERGLPLTLACVKSGVGASTFHAWRQRHPDFDERVNQAILTGVESRLAVIEEAATVGRDWRAAAWLLERANGEFFGKNRVEHEHRHVGVSFTVPAGVLDDLARARSRYDERKAIDVETTNETGA